MIGVSPMQQKICTNVRNPIRCPRCNSRLIAECLRDINETQQDGKFGFACPVCMNWNDQVHLEGFALIEVFQDPRAIVRD